MKVVVTGASGNVGTALLRALAASGHSVLGVSRRVPPRVPPYADVAWHSIDIGRPDATDRLSEVFAGVDAVVHLAWLLQPSRDRELLKQVNQGGTRAVIDACARADVPHLVHMSSLGTYAAAAKQVKDETWSTAGIDNSSYSIDKAAA